MTSLAATEKKMKVLQDEMKKVREEQRDIIRSYPVLCSKCKKMTKLSSWIFIQNRFYIEPHSCTAGDYWKDSETECCHIVCPECKEEAYLYRHSQRDQIVLLVDSYSFSKKELFDRVEKRAGR